MKRVIRPTDPEELRRQYPLDGQVSGWRFRAQETSAGVYLVEGSDRFGRAVSRRGVDPDELFVQCKRDARDIHRQLDDFGDNEEFYASVDVLCLDLASADFADLAERLRNATRSGSTGGEVLGATRQELRSIVATSACSDPKLRARVAFFIKTLDKAFGGRWRG
jgi:hypothetical protein